MKISKENLLKTLEEKISKVRASISLELQKVGMVASRLEGELMRMRKGEREHALMLKAAAVSRYKELQSIESSPFFFKCVVEHKALDVRQQAKREIYFGKSEFSEQGIYSWVAPIAVIRFSNPGHTSFKLPNGKLKEVNLHEKEQYLIVDGKVMFYSHESENQPRELIYQEHFSVKKGAFVLPEIVEVMEKAQDDVIRASYFGPFAIAGPAGSGKTTLALHRVAYLVQSPESAELYPSDSIVVFVQDIGTKEYFSHLLPELGITNVKINTFFEWASEILKLEGVVFKQNTECELDKLVLKNKIDSSTGILKIGEEEIRWNKNIFLTLDALYSKHGSEKLARHFLEQKRSQILDRVDVTIALMLFRARKGKLQIETESNRVVGINRVVRHIRTEVLDYSLVVVDEFQNYLPEQLGLFKNCIKGDTQSIVYVGDLSQKIQHGTIKNWEDFGEELLPERKIRLHKVYRNTKQILQYVEQLGFSVEIPESLKEGPVVSEIVLNHNDMLKREDCFASHISNILKNEGRLESISVGVLSFDYELLSKLKEYKDFQNMSNIKFLSVRESQGVEFDIVILIGVTQDMFNASAKYSEFPEFENERKQMSRDLLYIALTRSMREMHIIGECYLREALDILG